MKRLGIRLLFCALLLAGNAVRTTRADNTPQPLASYKIKVELKLDEQQHPRLLSGSERLTWLNDSPDAINELQFHLYLNAFKNRRSSFFAESGGELRGDQFDEAGGWGWIDIKELRLGSTDLTSQIEFIHPDDDNSNDQTVIRVPLAAAVAPGARITLDLKFDAQLPRVFARTGYWDSFALVAQWFPKIGVWEKVGARRRAQAGWNCHQFHANTEFYADFGDYEVTMTVPARYRGKLGATGKLTSEQANGATVTYNFAQENVHDFAWTVGGDYVPVTRRFKADEQVSAAELNAWAERLKLNVDQVRLKDLAVTLLIQREHAGQIDRHFKAAFAAIKSYGLRYGPYPYETLTVVDPPYNANGAGGMEYPTFITAGTDWWPSGDQNPEEVIVHEFGHQYWYGLVASNEFEESWLDEGFNSYSECKALEPVYGANPTPLRFFDVPIGYFPLTTPYPYDQRLGALRGAFRDPILTPGWRYYDSQSYVINSYMRPGLALRTLERYLGEDVMARVMREYASRWRFRHPTSQDFFDTANQISGQDLAWFFDQFMRGTATVDYEVAELSSELLGAKAGLYDKDGQRREVKEDEAAERKAGSKSYETTVTVRRNGEAWFPVELLVRLSDFTQVTARPVAVRNRVIEYLLEDTRTGQQWHDTWPLDERWKKFKFTTASEAATAQVDPEEKLLLDANLTNNSRAERTGAAAGVRWSAGALFWLQALLQAAGALI